MRDTHEKRCAATLALFRALVPSDRPIDRFREVFFDDYSDPSSASEYVLYRLFEAGKVSVVDMAAVLAARYPDESEET